VESSPKLKKGSSVLDLGRLGRRKNSPSASDLKSSLTPSGKLRRYAHERLSTTKGCNL
jgi:hypothetical protein